MSDGVLLDKLMPRYDATRIERRLLPADGEQVWRAVLDADFVRTAEEMPAVRFLFGARAMAERAVAAVRGEPAAAPPEVPSMCVRDLEVHGDWVLLGEDPPSEIAFGAIGRFWAGETAWREIDATEFASFDEPGLAKVACSFSLRPCDERSTLVSYECRTLATDAAARRGFLRYWRPLAPFIGFVLRAQLRTVETTLEEALRRG